ncbi:hypothetical protein BH23BAC4_BH23BAC4_12790 [soil metagenome]
MKRLVILTTALLVATSAFAQDRPDDAEESIANLETAPTAPLALPPVSAAALAVENEEGALRLWLDGSGALVMPGTFNFAGGGAVPVSGAGSRLMWLPERAAFRAGRVTGAQWDPANIGSYSIAFGANTTASGNFSTAMGFNTLAGGENSLATGFNTEASGLRSTAMGFNRRASGSSSLATGSYSEAAGSRSTAMGYNTRASGSSSLATGATTEAAGNFSTAMGYRAKSLHSGTFVWADFTNADFASTGDNQFLIRAGGGVGIGTNNPTERLHVAGNVRASAFVTTSDARFKTAVAPIVGAREAVLALRGVRYEWDRAAHPEADFPEGRQLGFIAQQVRDVLPELVREGSDGTLSVAYSQLVPVLVEALREQQAENDALTARLERLERMMEMMASRD